MRTFYFKRSPFLVDQLQKYFLGGVDDMSVWTTIIWDQVKIMLQNGMRYFIWPISYYRMLENAVKMSVTNEDIHVYTDNYLPG